jgi:hypothetical protein
MQQTETPVSPKENRGFGVYGAEKEHVAGVTPQMKRRPRGRLLASEMHLE